VDDNQWEPDEEFFVKLTLIPGPESEQVQLGKTSSTTMVRMFKTTPLHKGIFYRMV